MVAPTDFLRAFEQGSVSDRRCHGYTTAGILGGNACVGRAANLRPVGGIVADDAAGTIAFQLEAPDPEFLSRLTVPFAYPIPPSTPDAEQVMRASRARAPMSSRADD